VARGKVGALPWAAVSVDRWCAVAQGVDIRSRTGKVCLAVRSPALGAGSACTGSTADEDRIDESWEEEVAQDG